MVTVADAKGLVCISQVRTFMSAKNRNKERALKT